MANKRNSRVYEDDCLHGDTTARNKTLRSTRNSKEDLEKAAKDSAEHTQRKCNRTSSKESLPSMRSDSLVSTASGERSSASSSSKTSISEASSESSTAPLNGRPENFGVITPGVYRSSYPKTEDFEFLQSLQLKTVVTLVKKEEAEPDLVTFAAKNSIRHVVIDMKGTKKEDIPIQLLKTILDTMHDPRNHPLLVHCNRGKHRTGCVVGIMRKLSGWNLSNVLDEYRHYADPKIRDCDVDYLRGFQLTSLWDAPVDPMCVPFRPSRTFARILTLTIIVALIWMVSAYVFGGTKHYRPSLPN